MNTLSNRLFAAAGAACLLGAVGLVTSQSARSAGPGGPVSVASVYEPTQQPFSKSVYLPAGEGYVSITVPAGKRMVIETVSCEAIFDTTDRVFTVQVYTEAGGDTARTDIPVQYQATLAGGVGQSSYVGTQQVRLYADPGTAVYLVGQDTRGSASSYFTFGISGYYVNAS